MLGTKVIMVLGHTSCGAVDATVAALQKGNDLPGHIADLVRAMKPGIEPTLKQPGDDLRQRAVVANVQRLQELMSILADMRVKAGKLRVVGAVYDLPAGRWPWSRSNTRAARALTHRPDPWLFPEPGCQEPKSSGRT